MVGACAFGEYGGARLGHFALDSVLAWAYLVVMGSLVGFTAYAWLLAVAPISLVVTHQYVNPLVAIALGMAVPRRAAEPVGARRRGAGDRCGLRRDPRAEFPRKARRRPASAVPRGTPAGQTV